MTPRLTQVSPTLVLPVAPRYGVTVDFWLAQCACGNPCHGWDIVARLAAYVIVPAHDLPVMYKRTILVPNFYHSEG